MNGPETLLATPEPMLAWLRSLPPDRIVAKNMGDAQACLGTTFLRANGFANAEVIFTYGFWPGLDTNHETNSDSGFFNVGLIVSDVLFELARKENQYNVTAQKAITALEYRIKFPPR